jgi:radical SAM superfamily enzyme YgiQ (UPF0313 family)
MQKGDLFGSGIPYFPLTAAYAASYLIAQNYDVKLIDSFGENPTAIREKGDFYFQGLSPKEVVSRIDKKTKVIILFAERLVAYSNLVELIKEIKKKFSQPLILVENSQAVTSYSLLSVADELFKEGANYIVLGGEGERIIQAISLSLGKKVKAEGIIYLEKGKKKVLPAISSNVSLDNYPFPAWEKFKLKNYWDLGYSHAPLSSKKYLPLLTSRGCPLRCKFCVTYSLNHSRWRARSPQNVVNEMENFHNKLGINEYHLEDLNPTVDKKRMVEISKEILRRKLKFKWKIGSGTKIETLDKETIYWMAKAGCVYLSLSPESGSPEMLKKMNKSFDHKYALELVRFMYQLGMFTQACFVLGFPGESKRDLLLTKRYVHALVKAGISEIALFIITPAPGSDLYQAFPKKFQSLSQLTFSPKWREDYSYLNKFRSKLYLSFFCWRILYHPIKTIKQFITLINKRFDTKMEMTIYRYFRIKKMLRVNSRD